MIAFFNQIGTTEIIIILFVVLLLFGAKKLPELARGMGKSLLEFKRARKEFENELKETKKVIHTDDDSSDLKG